MARVLNKVIIITGGASGIGEAACHLLAQEGAIIALTDINHSAGNNTVQRIRQEEGQAEFWHMDTRNEAEVQQIMREINNQFGRIDVLVNNAAIIGSNNPTHEFSEEDWDKVMAVSVKGVLFCTKHVIPYFKKSWRGKYYQCFIGAWIIRNARLSRQSCRKRCGAVDEQNRCHALC